MISAGNFIDVHPGSLMCKPGMYLVASHTPNNRETSVYPIKLEDEPEKKRGRCKRPFLIRTQHLLSDLAAGLISRLEVQPRELLPPKNPAHEVVHLRNRQMLEEFVNKDFVDCLFLNKWKLTVEAYSQKYGLHETSVRRLLSRFFDEGMDIERAARSGFSRCGKKNDRVVKKKLGRPRKAFKAGHDLREGVNSLGFEKLVRIYLASRGENRDPISQEYRNFKKKFCARTVRIEENGQSVRIADRDEEIITDAQFRFLVKKIDGEKTKIFQISKGKRHTVRMLLNKARDGVTFPGHTYIIDSTIVDAYLVSGYVRSQLIGRPVLYIVVDAFSWLILSIHICLEGPNFKQANLTIYRAMTDKLAWLKWLSLTGLADCFRPAVRPLSFLSDRAELHSKKGRELAFNVKYSPALAAPYRADWKSMVERFFKILNDAVIHWVPGAVKARIKERGDRDVRLDGCLTLYEFTRIIVSECANWNATHSMSKYFSASMVGDGIDATPLSFWDWGLKNLHGSPFEYTSQGAIETFLPEEIGSASRQGILLNTRWHTADWMREHPTMLSAATGRPIEVPIIQCPDNPLEAYVRMPGENLFRTVGLKTPPSGNVQIVAEDITDFFAYTQMIEDVQNLDYAPRTDAMRDFQDDIIKNAEKSTKISHLENPQSKSERTKEIKKNRQEEIDRMEGRQQEPSPIPSNHFTENSSYSENSVFEDIASEIDGWGEND